MFKQNLNNWIAALTFIILTIVIGYTVEQTSFNFSLYGCWFAIYLWLIYGERSKSEVLFLILVGVVARLVLLPAFPLLSDDIYRFIWDGRLITQGQNPFNYLPTYWMESNGSELGLNKNLFDSLNSPEYFTIYPPICQSIFAISQWMAGTSIFGAAVVFKTFLIGFELGSLYFIYKILNFLKLPIKNILFYALNPLIIIEISGNLHFEGAMIFFFTLSIWLMLSKKWITSAIAFSLSVASKLLPLMFLPFILNYYGWKKGLKYCTLVGICSILYFLPLLSTTFIQNFSTSLDLYFQKFEFNASIYYIGRAIGEWKKGYNIIATLGPALGITTLMGIIGLAVMKKVTTVPSLLQGFLLAFTIYLFLGTTIHPWYLSIPILLSCFTKFRFPLLWSGLIMFTYFNYSETHYQEQLWLVGIEYVIVYTIFIYEIIRIIKGRSAQLIF